MAFSERDLSTYIDVAQRIADFRERYPEGCLKPFLDMEPYRIVQAEGWDKDGSLIQQTFVVVVAAAYRHPDDIMPGVGMAWEIFPGRTPYTRGSELQNAETSAWGRAIIAVGASDSKAGIASREEVRNRRAERAPAEVPEGLPSFTPALIPSGIGYELTLPCGCIGSYDRAGVLLGAVTTCQDHLPRNADGSLSRSRTTDEQKHAAGVMTDPEQRAHNALRRQNEPDPQDVHKSSTSDPQWYDAAAPLADLANPEDRHGTATADQIRAIIAKQTAKGMKTREDRMKWLKARCGPVESTKDLSYTQAAGVLQELAR